MKELNSEIIRKILISLYKYQVMTPWQLGVLLNHRTSYIYSALAKIKDLINQDKVKKISVPFIWPNAAAYYLDKQMAYWVSEILKEEVKPTNWPELPSSIIQTLTAHNFACELILATKDIAGAGVVEWLGPRDATEKYRDMDDRERKTYGLKLDGYGVCQLPEDAGQVIYNLDVYVGEETDLVLEDKVVSYITVLKNYWMDDVDKVSVLLLCHSSLIASRLAEMWESIADRTPGTLPMIGIAHYKDIIEQGIMGDIWRIPGQKDMTNIKNFAQTKIGKTTTGYIGKQENMSFAKQGFLLRKAKDSSLAKPDSQESLESADNGLGFTAADWTRKEER